MLKARFINHLNMFSLEHCSGKINFACDSTKRVVAGYEGTNSWFVFQYDWPWRSRTFKLVQLDYLQVILSWAVGTNSWFVFQYDWPWRSRTFKLVQLDYLQVILSWAVHAYSGHKNFFHMVNAAAMSWERWQAGHAISDGQTSCGSGGWQVLQSLKILSSLTFGRGSLVLYLMEEAKRGLSFTTAWPQHSKPFHRYPTERSDHHRYSAERSDHHRYSAERSDHHRYSAERSDDYCFLVFRSFLTAAGQ